MPYAAAPYGALPEPAESAQAAGGFVGAPVVAPQFAAAFGAAPFGALAFGGEESGTSGTLSGGAWVAGDGLMSKPRIGMARNGDLYSLVLDDDGIPVACKRMGTSRLLKLRALPGGNQAQVMVETGVVLVVL